MQVRTIEALLLFVTGAIVGNLRGEVFSYECTSLPPDAGWTVINEFCNPEQYVLDESLVQHTQLCDDPPVGQQFDYTRSLAEFDGAQSWLIEWRVFADGPQSEIPFTSPGLLSAYGFGSVFYHFVFARDRVRLARDNGGEVVYFDIAPTSPHVFRVEQHGIESFNVFIDGESVHSGVPFPAYSPAVNIRAKTHATENWVYWDYIRWGDIPTKGSGDFDSNGSVDSFDHFYFSECMDRSAAGEPAEPSCAWADFDADNNVDCADAAEFRDAWTGPGEPPPIACASAPAMSPLGATYMAFIIFVSGSFIIRRRHGA